MTDTNNVVIIGRITRDLDEKSYRTIGNGTACAKVSLAVNRSVKKDNQWQDEVSFIDVTIWGKTAENLKQYLTKGTQICVSGYLKQDRWQDKDGNNRSVLGVTADNVQLLGGKRDGQQSGEKKGFDPAAGYPEDCPF